MVKKIINKNKTKNKNTNFVNVNNTIKIGNNKKRSYRKRNQPKSGASSIVVSMPQPYYIPTSNPSYPFQPPVRDVPIQIKNPTKPIIDDMKRDSINAISEIPNIPVAVPVKSNFKDISQVVPHVSPQYPIKDGIIETPTKSFEEYSSKIKDTFINLKSRLQDLGPQPVKDEEDEAFELPPNITDNRKQRRKNATFQTPLKSSPLTKDTDTSPKVYNIATGRWIKKSGKTYTRLKRDGKLL